MSRDTRDRLEVQDIQVWMDVMELEERRGKLDFRENKDVTENWSEMTVTLIANTSLWRSRKATVKIIRAGETFSFPESRF